MIGTEGAKDTIFSQLAAPSPGPGYCHFPKREEYDEEYDESLFRVNMNTIECCIYLDDPDLVDMPKCLTGPHLCFFWLCRLCSSVKTSKIYGLFLLVLKLNFKFVRFSHL